MNPPLLMTELFCTLAQGKNLPQFELDYQRHIVKKING